MYYFVMNTLVTSDILDNIPIVARTVEDAVGDISRPKIVVFRFFLMFLSTLVAISTENVVAVLNLSGSFFSPMGSFIVPVG